LRQSLTGRSGPEEAFGDAVVVVVVVDVIMAVAEHRRLNGDQHPA
jgi:hypothetical protein